MQMSSVDLIYYINFLEQYDIPAYVLTDTLCSYNTKIITQLKQDNTAIH
jgi:hypothetical protein